MVNMKKSNKKKSLCFHILPCLRLPSTSDSSAQEMNEFRRLSSFAHEFYCCDGEDASVHEEYAGGKNANNNTHLDVGDDDGLRRHIIDELGGLSQREARAMNRMQTMTDSQWQLVMESWENADLQIRSMAGTSSAYNLKVVMEWRRERGDFRILDELEEEEALAELAIVGADAEEMQQLCDDMDEWNEAYLGLGFFKTDLQLECLMRGVAYDATDLKQTLVSKLMDFKRSSSLARNSLDILAEQSGK